MGKGGGDGENRRDISLTGHWASDVIKTLYSTISRQNKYYLMGEGRVPQECEGGREGPSLCGVLQRGGLKWPNILGGGGLSQSGLPHSWGCMGRDGIRKKEVRIGG